MSNVAGADRATQRTPGAQRTEYPLDPKFGSRESERLDNYAIEVNDSRQGPQEAVRPRKRSCHHWVRRIFIGKTEKEELMEATNHKTLNFLKMEFRRHMAEFVGSFFIVLFIAGIQVNQTFFAPTSGVANIDKGFVAGSVLTGLIYCFGQISGAHFNPCVTLAFFLRGSFYFPRFVSYVIVQFAGAVSGAAVLYGFFGNVGPGIGTTLPGPGIDDEVAYGIEALITFLLITVILSTAVSAHITGVTSGIAVGAMFGALEIWAWNFTGASANPWRTIGPTMISGVGWNKYWIYITGPITGTLVAVLLQRLMVTGFSRAEVKETGTGSGKLISQKTITIDQIKDDNGVGSTNNVGTINNIA